MRSSRGASSSIAFEYEDPAALPEDGPSLVDLGHEGGEVDVARSSFTRMEDM